MNPSTDPPPNPPPQPHRLSTSCDRHPEENFTGFCPSCLCERLAVLHPSTTTNSSASSSRKPPTSSTAAAALKAIFKPPIGGGGASKGRPTTSFLPELRRTKSFSASNNQGFSGVFEPQRKSCDVRGRSTLWCLFNQDDGRNPNNKDKPTWGAAGPEIEVDPRNVAGPSSSFRGPVVFESKEEEEQDEDEDEDEEEEQSKNDGGGRISDEPNAGNVIEIRVPEIVEEEEEDEIQQQQLNQRQQSEPVQFEEDEIKPMKDHLDLDGQTKKKIAGSFWSAASVFSKKLQKWRQKQKLKKRRNGGGSATLPVEKPIGRQFRETQSEIADYGFGRRSCDTDPRFSLDAGRMSLDAGRMSFDDPRYSFDEPRASWDGYLIGRSFQRMPTMLSVVEDAPVVVSRIDAHIPVEEPMNSINEEDPVPGGSVQTQNYYTDSSSRRRKSLDRSNSIRKTAAAVVAEIDEMKSGSNSKVSPTTTNTAAAEYLHGGPKLVIPDRDSNSNSLRDDCSETFEMAFRGGDPVIRGGDSVYRSGDSASVVGNGERKDCKQKSRRWSKAWNIWSFIHRRSGNKEDDEDRYSSRPNGVERSFSESWPELRGSGERNGEAKGFNPKITRSNSSASWRNSHSFGGGVFGSMRKNGAVVEPHVNGNGNANGNVNLNGSGRKKKEEVVLERNRSARYSPNHIDNGLLRFYLTPMRNSWRNGGPGKSRSNHAHSIARSVLRLY
ncbi:protein OCTOPUS [Argentina anserina]|uniref:protein OCTOPUS n=1 Tax=Argentina anserina TaxID=57926 RepID=UPI00217621AF|nr:protein OCTOPUS [Potentilla anserina]